ncbi:MAG: carboxypeptidase-like regulatory domain-containing protein [Myxococcota bacterium]|nr:carboxypeptidase-like regulatory domain-containing protein [Myxococcota bacterium]
MRLLLLALLVLPACSKSDDTSVDTGDSDTDTDTDTDSDTDTDTAPLVDTSLSGVFSGIVTEPGGEPIEGAKVAFCLGICRITDSDANGAFVFEGYHTGTYSFDIKMPGTNKASLMAPIDMEAGVDRDMAFAMYDLEELKPLPAVAAEVEMAPGFFATIGEDNLDMGFSPSETASAVRIPEAGQAWLEHSPIAGQGTVAAMWYLHPWESKASGDPVHFRIANEWGWEPGTAVTVWAASYQDFAFLSTGEVAVSSDGGWIEPAVGSGGLPVLSTVVVMAP